MSEWDLELRPARRGPGDRSAAARLGQGRASLEDIRDGLVAVLNAVDALSARMAVIEQNLGIQAGQDIADRAVEQLRAAREARRAARDARLANEANSAPPARTPAKRATRSKSADS